MSRKIEKETSGKMQNKNIREEEEGEEERKTRERTEQKQVREKK